MLVVAANLVLILVAIGGVFGQRWLHRHATRVRQAGRTPWYRVAVPCGLIGLGALGYATAILVTLYAPDAAQVSALALMAVVTALGIAGLLRGIGAVRRHLRVVPAPTGHAPRGQLVARIAVSLALLTLVGTAVRTGFVFQRVQLRSHAVRDQACTNSWYLTYRCVDGGCSVQVPISASASDTDIADVERTLRTTSVIRVRYHTERDLLHEFNTSMPANLRKEAPAPTFPPGGEVTATGTPAGRTIARVSRMHGVAHQPTWSMQGCLA
jgi:hypothetical protein